MPKKACRVCKLITTGSKCTLCGSTDLTTSFQGSIVVFDIESEIAKKMNITSPGKYAIRV